MLTKPALEMSNRIAGISSLVAADLLISNNIVATPTKAKSARQKSVDVDEPISRTVRRGWNGALKSGLCVSGMIVSWSQYVLFPNTSWSS